MKFQDSSAGTLAPELLEYLYRVLQLNRKQIKDCLSHWDLEQLQSKLAQNPQSLFSELGQLFPGAKSDVPRFGQHPPAKETYLTRKHSNYPESFHHLHDPPWVLYYRGDLQLLAQPGPRLTVVGTRSPSAYAQKACENLLKQLLPWDPLIVSGMAAGIDGVAHRTALKLGLKTVGILGTPLHRPYPAFHRSLFREMEEQGLLLTEVYPKAPMGPWRFPERNRLLAALGQVNLVVEAPEKSGALVTANLAVDLGREVVVVPGPLFPNQNRGGHRLIQQGAQILCQVEELAEILLGGNVQAKFFPQEKLVSTQKKPLPKKQKISVGYSGSQEGRQILELLNTGPMQIDKMIHFSQKSASEVSALLMELILEGWVEELPGAHFQLLGTQGS